MPSSTHGCLKVKTYPPKTDSDTLSSVVALSSFVETGCLSFTSCTIENQYHNHESYDCKTYI